MKHKKAPQVNTGVNYIGKHNASLDDNLEKKKDLVTANNNLQKNFSLSTSTTDSTLKSSDNSSAHNSSSIAAKYTALNKFVTSKIPHNSIKNVIARSLTTNLLENSSHQTSLYASNIPTTTTDQSFGSKTSRRFATIRGKRT